MRSFGSVIAIGAALLALTNTSGAEEAGFCGTSHPKGIYYVSRFGGEDRPLTQSSGLKYDSGGRFYFVAGDVPEGQESAWLVKVVTRAPYLKPDVVWVSRDIGGASQTLCPGEISNSSFWYDREEYLQHHRGHTSQPTLRDAFHLNVRNPVNVRNPALSPPCIRTDNPRAEESREQTYNSDFGAAETQ